MTSLKLKLIVSGLVVAGIAMALRTNGAAEPVKDAALERARKQVKMLDDLYKTAVVLITDTYVEDDGDTAAGEIARDLFKVMREKGWHDARLIDGTGAPINKDNTPRDEFERTAIKQMKAGEKYYEQVVEDKDNRTLRAATIVPVVMKKCTICHPGFKEGDLLGAISYKIKVE